MAKITDINRKLLIHPVELIVKEYSYLFEYMTEGVLIINDKARIVYVNPAYTEIFDVSNEAIMENSIFSKTKDEAVIKAFHQRKNIKGKLNYFVGGRQLIISAAPIYYQDKFQGAIAIYRKEDIINIEQQNTKLLSININEDNNKLPQLNSCFREIITKNRKMQEVLLIAQKASKVSSTILIRGESGTGKELVARAIHNSSPRKNQPFITVNCGAIPETLLESELFGHEQGSFTGAIKRKIGKFEEANGGTIFLDEIGDMPIEMQVKLLRVLQEKEFQRVGGNEVIKCDVRILSATHRNLERFIEEEKFRQDLYYRINVITVELPTLKERREDIELLCNHFIEKINKKIGSNVKALSEEVKTAFLEYNWPGNIRELENLMERLMVLAEDEVIELYEIPSNISKTYQVNQNFIKQSSLVNTGIDGEIYTLEEYEREIIKLALERFGSFNAAGKALGVTHKTIATKARKYKIVDN